MTTGQDFVPRLQSVLPRGWFGDAATNLRAILVSLATPLAFVYDLLAQISLQCRILTSTGESLDTVALDYFGASLPRALGEADAAYLLRIRRQMLQPAATRGALEALLSASSATPVRIFEPTRPADTGCYCGPALGYGCAGGWGSVCLPFQFFVDTSVGQAGGVADIAGYGTGGALSYISGAALPGVVPAELAFEAIARLLPIGTTAWVRFN